MLDAMGVVFDTGRDGPSLLAAFLRDQGVNLPVDEVGARLAEATLGQVSPEEMWRSLGIEGGHAIDPAHPVVLAFIEEVLAPKEERSIA